MFKPKLNFKEFVIESYGPDDIENIIQEAARKSVEEKFKPKPPKIGRAAGGDHRRRAEDHGQTATGLDHAAKNTPSFEQHEMFTRMASAHRDAEKAHNDAARSHEEYENKGMVGSGQRRKDAKRATEEANRITQIAHETT